LIFSRLQDIQGTFSFERGSVITRVAGMRVPVRDRIHRPCLPASRRSTTRSSPRIGRTPPGEHHDPSTSNITVDARADHRLTFTTETWEARGASSSSRSPI